jgi:hypothetical protein
VKLRQFEEDAFERGEHSLPAHMDAIAAQTHGAFSGKQLQGAIEGLTHAVFYYCTDDLDIMGVVVVTKIVNAEGNHVMVVVGAAGRSLGEWSDANDLLSELGKAMNCIGVEIKGRKGFLEVFKDMGWTEQYISMYRPIEG